MMVFTNGVFSQSNIKGPPSVPRRARYIGRKSAGTY